MCLCVYELMQFILTLVFIWTVEVYSLIQNTTFVNLCFDVFVVVGFIRFRWTERRQPSTSANQRTFKVDAIYYLLLISFDFILNNRRCIVTFCRCTDLRWLFLELLAGRVYIQHTVVRSPDYSRILLLGCSHNLCFLLFDS